MVLTNQNKVTITPYVLKKRFRKKKINGRSPSILFCVTKELKVVPGVLLVLLRNQGLCYKMCFITDTDVKPQGWKATPIQNLAIRDFETDVLYAPFKTHT